MVDEVIEPQSSEMLSQVTNHQEGLPEGTAPVVPEPVPEPTPKPAEPVVEPEGTFEYDGQKFASEKEAFEYLKGKHGELKSTSMLDEARLQGMQEAFSYAPQQTTQPVEEPAIPTADMDQFYVNPGKYLADRDQATEDRVMQKVNANQTKLQRDTEVWHNFTNAYPDLADFRADVEGVADQYGNEVRMLASRDEKKAMDFVAMKVREKFQKYVDVMKPTKTLSNTKSGPSTGGNQVVTPVEKEPEDTKGLDMVSQMRTMRG